ncbi:AMP-binding protein [Nocardia asteroides]
MHVTESGGSRALPQRSTEPRPFPAAPVPFASAPAQLGVWAARALDGPIGVAQYVTVGGELDAVRPKEGSAGALLAERCFPCRTSPVSASREALPAAFAQRLRAVTGARVHDLYGPTEAAVDVIVHDVTGTGTLSVPIGASVLGTRLYVFDSRLRPVPVGAPGELYLSGVQLARGHLARPELTAAWFVAGQFAGPDRSASAGDRMCRTGDPVGCRASTGYAAPAGAVEQADAEALGNKPVGRNDDFFALGGNRPVALRVAARPAADPNCPLGVRDVFAACTVAELAALVERAGGSGGASSVEQLRARPRPPLVPLSPARRIRLLHRFERCASSTMPFVVRPRGAVDTTALRQARDDVVLRHEGLRTIVPTPLSGDGAEPAARQVASSAAKVARAPLAIAAEPFTALPTRVGEPFERAVTALDPPRSQARHPLCRVLLAFDNAGAIVFDLPELSVATSTLDTGVTELDLRFDPQFTVTENSAGAGLGEGSVPAGVPAESLAGTDLLASATIAGHTCQLIGFFWANTAGPGIAVSDQRLLDHDERARVRAAVRAPLGANDPVETPHTASECTDAAAPAPIASPRTVSAALVALTGEAAAAPSPALVPDLHGPTVRATHAFIDPATNGPAPVGRRVPGSRAMVLGARWRPVPDTVIGELSSPGRQPARGYHGRADLSAGRSVAGRYGSAGARRCRTGVPARRRRASASGSAVDSGGNR